MAVSLEASVADREWTNYLRRERAREEREERERIHAVQEQRAQADRAHFGPLLHAADPIRLVFTYRKVARGVRAEAVGLGHACEASSVDEARRGLTRLIRERAKLFPGEILEATQVDASAEEVTIDLKGRRPARVRSEVH